MSDPSSAAAGHDHPHDHDHPHGHGDGHTHQSGDGGAFAAETRTVVLEQQILAKNDTTAQRNRGWLDGRGVLAVNVMGSPGSGKTTLLERTVREFTAERPVAVIEGDQETTRDAERIRAAGSPVVQVNTGAGCHLDAAMLDDALRRLDPRPGTVLFVENVGNLVCPALFDLGENARVVLMSVTEGEDKPVKYPHMFRAADLVLLTKTDLLPHLEFDVERFLEFAGQVSPAAEVLRVSATSGAGIGDWFAWLGTRSQAVTVAGRD